MSLDPSEPLLLVIDRMQLRRALLSRFLQDWAKEHDLQIDVGDVKKLCTADMSRCALILISLGSGDFAEAFARSVEQTLSKLSPQVPFVFVAEKADAADAKHALELGASGYVPMDLAEETFFSALLFIRSGGTFFPLEILKKMMVEREQDQPHPPRRSRIAHSATTQSTDSLTQGRILSRPGPESLDLTGVECLTAVLREPDLTGRQREVLECLREACSNKQIARKLAMSEATVKVHIRQLMSKLGATNRTHAALIATQLERRTLPPPLTALRAAGAVLRAEPGLWLAQEPSVGLASASPGSAKPIRR